MTGPVPRTKEAHLAGRWYPADAGALRARLDALLEAAGPPLAGTRAIVAPHAPLDAAGAVAARAWAAARAPWRRVLIVGPSHYARFRGAATLAMDAYRTPLGAVALGGDAPAAPAVRPNPALYLREHTLEAQLPWVRVVAPDATVTALLVGALDPDEVATLARAVAAWWTPDALVVVSTDLVHYGRRHEFVPVPATDPAAVAATVERLDAGALDALASGDPARFAAWRAESGAPVCGHVALDVLLRALPPGTTARVLAHATSLDAGGDCEHTVGYGAVAFGPPAA